MDYANTGVVNQSNIKFLLSKTGYIGRILCYPGLKPKEEVVAFDDLDGRRKVF